jgi:hypothetical protein
MADDYRKRKYLSSTEAAKYLGITVEMLHVLVKANKINCIVAASGQKRFDRQNLKNYEESNPNNKLKEKTEISIENVLDINNTIQKIFVKNAMNMSEVRDNSIHLMVTSPPYFDAKMYTKEPLENDLGNMHDLNR